MGSLKLPDSGKIYLDANALICSVEKIEPFWSLLAPVWQAAQAGRVEIVSSELAYLDCSVQPVRAKDHVLEQVYRDLLLHSRDVRLLPIQFNAIEQATAIRAASGLKTPDAIHAATSLQSGAALFLTNDHRFRRVSSLAVAV